MRQKTCLALSLALACGVFSAHAATDSRRVEVTSQPLAEALAKFARRSGVQLIYESSLTQDLMSYGAPAGLSREETLQRLL